MPKKSFFWGTLALLLFSTVAYALYDDGDDDDGDFTTNNNVNLETDKDFLKTWTHTMIVSIQNDEDFSLDDEIKVKANVNKDTGNNGKKFWKTDDVIIFSFHLPNKARLSVDLKSASKDGLTGEAVVLWNDDNLKENGKRKKIKFDGQGSTQTLELTSNEEENTLTLLCTQGEIGVESLKIKATIAYPTWKFEDVSLRLTSPDPGRTLDGNPVMIRWEEVKPGQAEGGWVKWLYRVPGEDWKEVPGLESVSYGEENWGNFLWKNPPKDKTCEFRPEYKRGKNPTYVVYEARKKLIKEKTNFLDETEKLIPPSFWHKDLKELRPQIRILKARIDMALEDEENLDTKKVVEFINKLEQLYFNTFQMIMEVAPSLQDENERKEIQTNVGIFVENLSQAFTNARIRYGEDEYAKDLVGELFPKERFDVFKTAKEEFDRMMKAYEFAYQLKEKYKNPKVEEKIEEPKRMGGLLRRLAIAAEQTGGPTREELINSGAFSGSNLLGGPTREELLKGWCN